MQIIAQRVLASHGVPSIVFVICVASCTCMQMNALIKRLIAPSFPYSHSMLCQFGQCLQTPCMFFAQPAFFGGEERDERVLESIEVSEILCIVTVTKSRGIILR